MKRFFVFLFITAFFGQAFTANAIDMPGAKDAKAGDIGRLETSSGVCEWLNPANGVYGIHTFAADASDWDSKFFIVFADEVVPAGTVIDIKFEYRQSDDGGDVTFNAFGNSDPDEFVNFDGWSAIKATTDWLTFERSITTTGPIRTFAVNCSIGREDGTLYLRNIVVEVNHETIIETKETTDDVADLNNSGTPNPNETSTDTVVVKKAAFVGFDNTRGAYDLEIEKNGGDNVFVFSVGKSTSNPWDVQFFAHWEYELASGSEKKISFDYKTDYANAGGWNISHVDIETGDGNQGVKWGAIAPTTEWKHFEESISKNWFWQFQLGMTNPEQDYKIYLKNVEITVDGKVVASSNDLATDPDAQQGGNEQGNENQGGENQNGDFKSGDLYYNITNNAEPYTVEVTYQEYSSNNYSGLTSVVIPDKVSFNGVEYVVIAIGDRAFYCSHITSITIPNSVTRIGDGAFMECLDITSLTISESVTKIGDYAFYACNKVAYNEYDNAYYLGNAENPYVALIKTKSNDITSCVINENCKFIQSSAFDGCKSLSTITIPESVTSIGISTFKGCKALTSVAIPTSLTSIGNSAFRDCNSLVSVIIPASVISIGSSVFSGCSSLDSVCCVAESKPDGWDSDWWAGNVVWNYNNDSQNSNENNPGTAVSETAANAVNIYAYGNKIVVENATDEIRIYDAMGALVCRDVACRVRTAITVNTTGVYIVKTGSTVKRVLIK